MPKELLVGLFIGIAALLLFAGGQFEGGSQEQGEEIGLLIESGRYEEAIEGLRAIEEFATSVEMTGVFNELGFVFNQLERYEEAIASLTRGMSINVSSANLYANRAIAHDRLQRDAEAEADFTEAIRLDPNSYLRYRARGSFYATRDRLTDALRDFDQAIALSPTAADIRWMRAEVNMSAGQFPQAIADLRRVLELEASGRNRDIAIEDLGKLGVAP